MKEIWKAIPDYEGIYEISNLGRIKVLNHVVIRKDGKPYTVKEKIVKSHVVKGYDQATLIYNGKKEFIGVHRLVAMAFISNPLNKPEVNHQDGNKHNNTVENLEWVTSAENIQHAFKHGLRVPTKGNAKLSIQQVEMIKQRYRDRKKRHWGKKALARELGIAESTIDFITHNKTWGEVNVNGTI